MYWPVGAPRIYAATNIACGSRTLDHLKLDDADEFEHLSEASVPTPTAGDSAGDKVSEVEPEVREASDDVTAGAGIATDIHEAAGNEGGNNSIQHEKVEGSDSRNRDSDITSVDGQAIRPAIVALKTSRSGHIFATITSQTLVIWQTRASSRHPRSLAWGEHG